MTWHWWCITCIYFWTFIAFDTQRVANSLSRGSLIQRSFGVGPRYIEKSILSCSQAAWIALRKGRREKHLVQFWKLNYKVSWVLDAEQDRHIGVSKTGSRVRTDSQRIRRKCRDKCLGYLWMCKNIRRNTPMPWENTLYLNICVKSD